MAPPGRGLGAGTTHPAAHEAYTTFKGWPTAQSALRFLRRQESGDGRLDPERARRANLMRQEAAGAWRIFAGRTILCLPTTPFPRAAALKAVGADPRAIASPAVRPGGLARPSAGQLRARRLTVCRSAIIIGPRGSVPWWPWRGARKAG
jgi:hypothetical protein